MKTVKHILEAKGPEVHTIGPDDSVLDALKRMAEKGVGALVVTEASGQIVGLLSERDYARKVVLLGSDSPDLPQTLVAQAFAGPPDHGPSAGTFA